jgi:hypothetical protein
VVAGADGEPSMTVVAGALMAVLLWGSLLAMAVGRRRSQHVAWWCASTDFDAITSPRFGRQDLRRRR